MIGESALKTLKVLDIGHYIAGPFCTKVLAQLGAQVIKAERPDVGDPARRIAPFLKKGPLSEKSALFFYLNTGKRGITLNLKQEGGKRIFENLVREADLVVENFRPGVMAGLGLGYERLREINPRIIMTSISNFGATGPYRDWKSSELVSFALGGLSYSSYGTPGRLLLKPFGSVAQHFAGLLAAIGSLIAYYYQQQTGQGQYVDASIMECLASLEEHSVLMASYRGEVRKRADHHPTNHPNLTLPCKDGYIHIVTSGASQWQKLCLIAGFPEAWRAEGSPFTDGLYRRQHSDEIDVYLKPWLMSHTKQELKELARELLLPFAPIVTIPELLEDPQLKERGFFVNLETQWGEKVTIPGFPFVMSQTPGKIGRAPLLGEHNAEIYCGELGYSREDLVRLRGLNTI